MPIVPKQKQAARDPVRWWFVLAVMSFVLVGTGAYLDTIKVRKTLQRTRLHRVTCELFD